MKFQGPGQYHVTGVDRLDEDEVDDDKVALLNLEKNIASIERSMSASQLEKAKHRMEQNKKVIFYENHYFQIHPIVINPSSYWMLLE